MNDLLENPVLDQRIEFDAENTFQVIAEQRFSSVQLAPCNVELLSLSTRLPQTGSTCGGCHGSAPWLDAVWLVVFLKSNAFCKGRVLIWINNASQWTIFASKIQGARNVRIGMCGSALIDSTLKSLECSQFSLPCFGGSLSGLQDDGVLTMHFDKRAFSISHVY